MSGGETVTDPARGTGLRHRVAEPWEVDAARRGRVTDVLDRLPVGFVVFHDVELPKPSRSVVDHLVIGPRSIWAVATATYADPIEVGRGRGADTLWAGRLPLRSALEACEAEADAIAELIGRPVEPLLCVDAPSMPDAAFDFHGIAVCIPDALAVQVGVTTTDFHDVNTISDDIQRVFACTPATRDTVPTLRSATPLRGGSRPLRRWPSFPMRVVQCHLPAHRVVPIVVIVLLLTVLPNVVGLGTSVAQKGVEGVTGALTPSTLVSQAAGNDDAPLMPPPDVWYVVTCPEPGAGWLVTWVWPGDLPASVASYGISTRSVAGVRIDRTVGGWTDPSVVPEAVQLATSENITVITEYRDASGATIQSTDEAFRRPPGDC
ncbi:MAG: nuclease-related domain-containing protein [Ilumatobacteraceae bacterium]